MGIYLSSPDTRKSSTDGENKIVKFGATAMQGWRLNMEDAEIFDVNFKGDDCLFAFFDGHGGAEVAKFCKSHFGEKLRANKNFETNIEKALIDTFFQMDVLLQSPAGQAELKQLKTDSEGGDSFAGCTANVIYIRDGFIYCANAGDSRAIVWDGAVQHLSKDHKPDNELEKARISKAGGFIIEGRVNGNLNLSRAIGDLEYKKNPSLNPNEQLISAEPEIVKKAITKADEFIVMGCDGIWEIMSDLEICQIVTKGILNGQSMPTIAETILDKGLAPDTSQGTGCDNMSAIVIQLKK